MAALPPSRRARLACGLALLAGFLTLPLSGALVLFTYACGRLVPGALGPAARAAIEAVPTVGAGLGLVCAVAALLLGRRERMAVEAGALPSADTGLARAAEIIGACVAPLAGFLFVGALQYALR